jgi:hypothetical protein
MYWSIVALDVMINGDRIREYARKVGDTVGDGGGCAETWKSLSELRNSEAESRRGEDSSIDRRSVLKRTGQVSVAGFLPAASGVDEVSARTNVRGRLRETASRYATKTDVQKAVATHTEELESVLEREGMFESSLAELVGEPASLEEKASSAKRTIVTASVERGASTATIKFEAPTPKGKLLVVVKPELNYSHALVTRNSGDSSESFAVLSPSVGEARANNVVTTSNCCLKATTCHGVCGIGGNCGCVATEVECCNGQCVEGATDYSGTGCSGICEPSSPCQGVNCPTC